MSTNYTFRPPFGKGRGVTGEKSIDEAISIPGFRLQRDPEARNESQRNVERSAGEEDEQMNHSAAEQPVFQGGSASIPDIKSARHVLRRESLSSSGVLSQRSAGRLLPRTSPTWTTCSGGQNIQGTCLENHQDGIIKMKIYPKTSKSKQR